MVEEGGERLLQTCGEPLLCVGEVVPCLHAGVAGSKRGVGIDHAEFDLAVEPLLTDHVPSGVVATPVLLEVLVGRLMGCVGRPERQVGEERTIRAEALVVVDHQQQLIDQVFGEVVALRRRGRRIDVRVVPHEFGVELIGLAREEAVEALEASGQRPLIERASGGHMGPRSQVPLPGAQRGVALVTQDLGHRGGGIRDVPERIREAGDPPGQAPHADLVLGAPGEKRRSRRRAHRRDVEVGELHPATRERVDVGRVDVGPVAAELGKAGVVQQDEHHVRRPLLGVGRLLEVRFGVREGPANRSLEAVGG